MKTRKPSKVFLPPAIMGLACCALAPLASPGQSLTNQWTFDETASPYANSVPGGPSMVQNPATTTAGTRAGETGNPGDNAVVLQYADPGPSTSLTAAGALPDALGFSFYINPTFIGNWNNLIDETSGGGNGTFQVHMLGDVTSVAGGVAGTMEFAVRGTGGSQGFAAVTQNATISYNQWVEIAGQYNPASGAISLTVGNAVVNGAGDLGLLAGNGSQLVVGTDTSIGAFAFGGAVDDLKIYNIAAVPEPAAYALAGIGLACLMIFRRRN